MDRYIGKKLDGRYEIKEIIGVGGMANVYKAYDSIDDRAVAVKILRDEHMQNDELLRRFRNESKAIAVLSHPNIVKVYDVSFNEDIQYIVMEHIDGITLKEYIKSNGKAANTLRFPDRGIPHKVQSRGHWDVCRRSNTGTCPYQSRKRLHRRYGRLQSRL